MSTTAPKSSTSARLMCSSPPAGPLPAAIDKQTPTVESLRAGLQSLSQDLFQVIADLVTEYDGSTASASTGTTLIVVTAEYKPPFQLQLDHRIRAAYAKRYYAETTFYFPSLQMPAGSSNNACLWVRSLDLTCRQLLQDVRCERNWFQEFTGRDKNTLKELDPSFEDAKGVVRSGAEDELMRDILSAEQKVHGFYLVPGEKPSGEDVGEDGKTRQERDAETNAYVEWRMAMSPESQWHHLFRCMKYWDWDRPQSMRMVLLE